MRVLLVEGAKSAACETTFALRSIDALIDQVNTGKEALELTKRYDYDVVMLELMLQDMDGYEVLRRVRLARVDTPVVILSNLSQLQAKVKAFGLGADDFITKPCDGAEMTARLQAVMRRSKGYSQPTLRIGNMQLNIDSRELKVNDVNLHLTAKEYSVLELLMLRKDMILTKEIFLDHIYGGIDEPEMKIIDVFICKLRKKLVEARADCPIETVWGRGYTIRTHGTKAMKLRQAAPIPIAEMAG